jgi:hypothetical protein
LAIGDTLRSRCDHECTETTSAAPEGAALNNSDEPNDQPVKAGTTGTTGSGTIPSPIGIDWASMSSPFSEV